MNWQDHLRKWIECGAILTLCAVASICVWRVSDSAQGAVKELTVTEGKIDATLDAVNRGCAPGPCGTLAEVNKSAVKIQDIAVTLQKQVAQSGQLVDAATSNLNSTSAKLNDELISLKTLTDNAAISADKASVALGTANTVIASFQPLSTQASAFIAHTDDTVNSLQVRDTLTSIDGTAQNMDQATGDFAKRFHAILFPPPCKTFGCRFQRYAWPMMKDGAAFGSDLYWTGQILGRTVPVQIQH